MAKYKIVHYLNQFYAQIGGEEKADIGPLKMKGAVGPGVVLTAMLGEDVEITATVICGDNYFADHQDDAEKQLLSMVEAENPDILLAGPGFNAGRYGLACGSICSLVKKKLQIPVLTALYPENPGTEMFRKEFYIVETGISAASMKTVLKPFAGLAGKLLRGDTIGFPEEEGYIPQGFRVNVHTELNGAERGTQMLLKKMKGEAFTTELPMPEFDYVEPAPAVKDLRHAKVALVTSGGIVPNGNPDHIESANASKYGKYSLEGLNSLKDHFTTVHGGYDPVYATDDPDRVVPYDALLELQKNDEIGSIYPYLNSTTGNTTAVSSAKKYGAEIAQDLLKNGVQAAILTSN